MERFHSSLSMDSYLQEANDALLTIVQIETKGALEDIDEIAAVPGVDVLFIGPFDLGINIGYPILKGVMRDELHSAIATVLKAATKAGKKAGIFCSSGEQAKSYADQGFQMISVATDMAALTNAVTSAVAIAKGSGPVRETGGYGK